MGIRITDNEHYAIYDSVSDTAFGPIFDSEDAAQEFLDWSNEKFPGADLRSMTPNELEVAYKRFVDESLDNDSLEDLPV